MKQSTRPRCATKFFRGAGPAAGSITCARLQCKDTLLGTPLQPRHHRAEAPPWHGGPEILIGLRRTKGFRVADVWQHNLHFHMLEGCDPRQLIRWACLLSRCAYAFQVPDEDFLSPPQTRKLGEAVISHSRVGMSLGNITWAKFPDGFPNIFVHDVDKLKVSHLFSLNPSPRPHLSLPLQCPLGNNSPRPPAEDSSLIAAARL